MGCVSWVLLGHGIRGRFRPPNGPPDSEKPLYLHISAGVQVRCPVSVDESTLKSPSVRAQAYLHNLFQLK
jgi:hypothetical protein